jgi:mRNA-decapping enzyme 1B
MWYSDRCGGFLIGKSDSIFLTDNLVEDLLSDFEYELQPPYLLYRNAAQEVNGIWFYNQHDCEAVASLFGR